MYVGSYHTIHQQHGAGELVGRRWRGLISSHTCVLCRRSGEWDANYTEQSGHMYTKCGQHACQPTGPLTCGVLNSGPAYNILIHVTPTSYGATHLPCKLLS